MKKILVVEDILSIRTAIIDLLNTNYKTFSAGNYESAIEILKNESIDLLITDIKMPGKSGLDLIKYVREFYPNTLYTLITAYNINDYIRFAKENQVWNIIPKYSFLDLNFISIMVNKLLTKDIFGVEKYFDLNLKVINTEKTTKFKSAKNKELIFKQIRSDKERESLCNKIGKFFVEQGAPKNIHQVIEELSSNAMIRAPRDGMGKPKFQIELPSKDIVISNEKIDLTEQDYFEIGYGVYDKTCILVTRDNFGSLKKEEILNRLDRHINLDEKTNLPLGITDTHGRGLYICREISDSMIFNIKLGSQTEIISLITTQETKSYKTLSIFEI